MRVQLCQRVCFGGGRGVRDVRGRRVHSNPSGSGELSELIVLYHLRAEVQNWAELSTAQSWGWWSLCPLEPDWLRWRDTESVGPAASQLRMKALGKVEMQREESRGWRSLAAAVIIIILQTSLFIPWGPATDKGKEKFDSARFPNNFYEICKLKSAHFLPLLILHAGLQGFLQAMPDTSWWRQGSLVKLQVYCSIEMLTSIQADGQVKKKKDVQKPTCMHGVFILRGAEQALKRTRRSLELE